MWILAPVTAGIPLQIATAQVIRRFRSLDRPLEEIHTVIAAPDPATRNELISAHPSRLEANLARTQRSNRIASGPAATAS